uniref:biotin/lipoyl-containing protein n=1 Tax=Methylibium sp. TaxID=2067992 RepID=UPI001857B08E
MALMEVKVPDIGDFESVEIIEVLVKPGDRIKAEQSLVTVESDKASMEIPSSHAGVVKELRVKLGDKVREGSVVLMLEAADAAGQAVAAEEAPQSAPDTQTSGARTEGSADDMAASPPPAGAIAVPGGQPPAAPAASGAAASTSGETREVVVPDIGDFDQVAVIELLVQPGDSVTAEQSLITVESDKASMEIPSSHAGTVERVLVKVGDSVSKGTPIVVLAGAAGAKGDGPGRSAAAPAPAQTAPAQAPAAASAPALASRPVERTLPTAALPAHEPS